MIVGGKGQPESMADFLRFPITSIQVKQFNIFTEQKIQSFEIGILFGDNVWPMDALRIDGVKKATKT